MMFLLFVFLGCLSLSSCVIENVGIWCIVLLFALGCSCVCVTCVFVTFGVASDWMDGPEDTACNDGPCGLQ